MYYNCFYKTPLELVNANKMGVKYSFEQDYEYSIEFLVINLFAIFNKILLFQKLHNDYRHLN